jgi:hypothetical protein
VSYANAQITLHTGDIYKVCEHPEAVVHERTLALREERLMELERPIIPAGQKLWLDPTQIAAIRRAT